LGTVLTKTFCSDEAAALLDLLDMILWRSEQHKTNGRYWREKRMIPIVIWPWQKPSWLKGDWKGGRWRIHPSCCCPTELVCCYGVYFNPFLLLLLPDRAQWGVFSVVSLYSSYTLDKWNWWFFFWSFYQNWTYRGRPHVAWFFLKGGR
jgi:hypothetical protein